MLVVEKHAKRYHWKLFTARPLSFWRTVIATRKGKAGTTQHAVWSALSPAISQLNRQHGVVTLTGAQFYRLLHASAAQHGWEVTRSAPRRPEVPPGLKWCPRCKRMKDPSLFTAIASPARLRSYGWDKNREVEGNKGRVKIVAAPARQTYLHHLCQTCREVKRAAAKRVPGRQATAAGKALRAQMSARMQSTRIAIRTLLAGWPNEEAAAADSNLAFYRMRAHLIELVRERIIERETAGVACPHTWQALLTKEEHAALTQAHTQGTWGRRTPEVY